MINRVRFWCYKIIPLIYDDSLSYYEVLCKLKAKINEIIEVTNNFSENVQIIVEGILDDWYNDGTLAEMFEQFGYLVSVKRFGAKGDGTTDDSLAFHDFEDYNGGLKYIPSGEYNYSGSVHYFREGCLGNGVDWVMPHENYSYKQESMETPFGNHMGRTGPIMLHHREVDNKSNIGPIISISFEQTANADYQWNTYGTGVTGIEVRGMIEGTNNGMPIGIRSYMENRLQGDGDAVAVWGRTFKTDYNGNPNNSDACGVHSMIINDSLGTGISMASEHWARVLKTQGSQGTNFAYYFDEGGTVCQHINARSKYGMAQALSLYSNPADTDDYGSWSVININAKACKYNGSTVYPARTAFFKMPDVNLTQCPNYINWYGLAPYHVKMNGAYPYNVGSNFTEFFNSTDDGSVSFGITRQNVLASPNGKTATLFLAEKSYGGVEHAPNINGERTIFWRVYHEHGNKDVLYRAEGSENNGHVFFTTDSEGTLRSSLGILATGVIPGRNSALSLGASSYRWTEVFADTGTINTSDERYKTEIEDVEEKVFRAWGKIGFKSFKFKEAVNLKGDKARKHIGIIAQDVIKAFKEEGLDAFEYGLLCYDKWDKEDRVVSTEVVVDEEAIIENGVEIKPAKTHTNIVVLNEGREAGDMYSIRYDEALALECAYQRYLLRKEK